MRNCSGRGVGQTSGLTVGRASGPEFPHCHRIKMPEGGAFLPLLLTLEGGAFGIDSPRSRALPSVVAVFGRI